jgi:NAD(P)-dependent dehydrogenase (short-subunit alcohol dehydrogenase family)
VTSEGRTVLVSGAASGIGRRIAERFLEQGDAVHICDVSEQAVADFVGANSNAATASVADIGVREDVDRLFSEFAEHHKHLDVLVNNAGVAGPVGPVETLDEDGWDDCIRTNLSGSFYMTKRAVPLLRKSSDASIINIASTAALMGCPNRSPYVATKWAQIGLTKTWAMELGPEGIRVNAVCPTSVDGARIDRVIEDEANQRGLSADEIREVYLRQTSMRSFATPDEVADTVLFLASDQAKRISGQALAVDGHTEGFLNWLDK